MELQAKHKAKIIVIKKALRTLYDVIKLAHAKENSPEHQVFLDSMIKRFEYCFDCFWKVLRDHIVVTMRMEKLLTPYVTFVAALDSGIISVDQFDELVQMLEDHNNCSHGYHKEVANQIASRIPEYYKLMEAVIKVTES